MGKRATFIDMKDGTAEDWSCIVDEFIPFASRLPDRVLDQLRQLGEDCGGFAVDRLTHSLQTATRAYRDGRDEEYVICALLHDIGDLLGSYNHPDIAAAMLKPFVSEQNHWMVAHHGIFQGHYYFHYVGGDRNQRDAYRDHPWYDYTLEFCEKYDSPAFDPEYDTLGLEFFEPMLRRVMAQPWTSDQ